MIILNPDLADSKDFFSPLFTPNSTTIETLQAVDRQEGLETVSLAQLQSAWRQTERE